MKNFLIFIPLLFGKKLFDLNVLQNSILGFIAFSLSCSIVYIINDINDIENDKLHPIKKNRPFASGKISIRNGIFMLIILSLIVISINIYLNNILAFICILFYIFINILYSIQLKHQPIIDIAIISIGFVLRVIYGSFISNISISNWLCLTVIAMSFYLGFGKRRNEFQKNGTHSRKVLKFYTYEFLDKNMYVFLTLAIVFYSLWCVDINTIWRFGFKNMVITVPIVLLICLKYSLNIEGNTYGDPVDIIIHDKMLLLLLFMYFILIILIIYSSLIINLI